MIIKKKRINKLTCLEWLNENQKIVLSLNSAMRFKETLIALGFTDKLEEGERMLPQILNPATERNAERWYVPDKTKPKEKYTQILWWTRREWSGRGETREVSDFVNITRKRYPRKEYEPYSVELILKYTNSNQLSVIMDPIVYTSDNKKLILNSINIFLTMFGECEILTNELNSLEPIKTNLLNWEILPKGEYPWKIIKKHLEKMSKNNSETNRKVMSDRCQYIEGFNPDFRAVGNAGFSGYIVFGFEQKQIYVLESIYPENATYVFTDKWKELSQFTKAHILNCGLQKARLIHRENWEGNIKSILD